VQEETRNGKTVASKPAASDDRHAYIQEKALHVAASAAPTAVGPLTFSFTLSYLSIYPSLVLAAIEIDR
jgi:hypothetical protein